MPKTLPRSLAQGNALAAAAVWPLSRIGTPAKRPLPRPARAGKGEAMETLDYARMSEEAMAAADRASTLAECHRHLDRAMRYAQLACMEQRGPGRSNVVDIGSARRPAD